MTKKLIPTREEAEAVEDALEHLRDNLTDTYFVVARQLRAALRSRPEPSPSETVLRDAVETMLPVLKGVRPLFSAEDEGGPRSIWTLKIDNAIAKAEQALSRAGQGGPEQ